MLSILFNRFHLDFKVFRKELSDAANVDNQQDRDQKTKNSVCFYHSSVDHCFGNFAWSLSNNVDTSSGNAALMNTRDQTGQSTWQTSSQNVKTLGRSKRSSLTTQEAAVEHYHDTNQEAVNTLCTWKSLKNQGLTEFIRVFCDQSCSSLTGNTYTFSGTDTAKTYSESCT